MKSHKQRMEEFAAKKAKIKAETAVAKADRTKQLKDGLAAASAQHAEAREKNAAKYEQRTEVIQDEWEDAKKKFRERRAARKNR